MKEEKQIRVKLLCFIIFIMKEEMATLSLNLCSFLVLDGTKNARKDVRKFGASRNTVMTALEMH